MKNKSLHLDRLHPNLSNKKNTHMDNFNYLHIPTDDEIRLLDSCPEIITDEFVNNVLHRCIYESPVGENKTSRCGRLVEDVRKDGEKITLRNIACYECIRREYTNLFFTNILSTLSLKYAQGSCLFRYKQGALSGVYCGRSTSFDFTGMSKTLYHSFGGPEEDILCSTCVKDVSCISRVKEILEYRCHYVTRRGSNPGSFCGKPALDSQTKKISTSEMRCKQCSRRNV